MFLIFTQFFVSPNCIDSNSTSCQTARKNNLEFSIHGLWPEFYNKTYPENCNKSATFNLTKIKDLEPQLNKYWLSYENGTNNTNPSFWKHEYLKHATCDPNTTEHQFFNKTLELYKKVNSTNTFDLYNIQKNKLYDKNELNKAFGGVFQCYPSDNDIFSVIYYLLFGSDEIQQLWRCYDLNLNQTDCLHSLDRTCKNQIMFRGSV